MSADTRGDQYVFRGDEIGSVSIREFLAWLNKFMVYGSDRKLFRCGKDSLYALTLLGQSQQCGFRLLTGSDEHNFQTPFGRATIFPDDDVNPGDIVVKDSGIPNDSRIKDKAEASAENIMRIQL